MIRPVIALALSLALGAFAGIDAAHAGKREKAERLVVSAAETADYFAADTAFEALWSLSDDAKAMVVIPNSIRAGFIFGGSAGNAVMLARNDDGAWSQPTFMTIGAFSFGLQAGGEASEIVLLVMTNRGMEQLLSTSAKLGADLTVAAGPIGAGAKAQTTDILAFSRSRGLYGGVSLEGAILKVRHNWNKAYYGEDVSPVDIIFREKVYNPQSAVLQNAVAALARRDDVGASAPALAPLSPAPQDGAPLEGARDLREGPDGEPVYEDDGAWGEPVYEDDDAWGEPVAPPR